MDNQELELKIKEILAIENFFDMMEALKAFEKEYKGTDFYKLTKMPLYEVIKESRTWYFLQLKDLQSKVQNFIDGLDFSKINTIINRIGETYSVENSDIMSLIKEFGEIVK